ncbi:hypothetical protein RSSM_06459 [Rhodopirellula sallentina SM41]|uniref:Uncharacterized protein n=1 Tax=Rhodopirellula sallentina SM41 TaxID=1263870 RepID=M5TSH9_9BACT|nr:hypothetical protein RSSM_06459 [Rhodopirellula sallentina SM41]
MSSRALPMQTARSCSGRHSRCSVGFFQSARIECRSTESDLIRSTKNGGPQLSREATVSCTSHQMHGNRPTPIADQIVWPEASELFTHEAGSLPGDPGVESAG